MGGHFRPISGGTPDKSIGAYWNGEIAWVSPKDFGDFEITRSEDHITDLGVKDRGLQIFEPGTLVMVVRSGVLKHTLPVALLGVRAAVNQDVKAFLPLKRELSSQFLNAYLTLRQDAILPLIVKHSTTVQSVNTAELENLQIPLPPPNIQTRLVEALDAARTAKGRKQEEADFLLGGLDAFVLDALGLTLPPSEGRTVYAVRLHDVARGRFDPHFFRPEYRELVRRFAKIPHLPLGKLIRLSREIWSPGESNAPTFRYIEISGVNTTTGEATAIETPVAKAPSRARMKVRCGDVIVSLTRPHYGAIALIDDSLDGCVASTGFAVLRDALEDALDRAYLCTILRCQVSLMQMQQRSSGGNYPAITEEELERVLVPVPDPATQKKIAEEVARRRNAARRLREEAAQLWDDAKRRFEEGLLGPLRTEP